MLDWTAASTLSIASIAVNMGIGLVLAVIVAWYYVHYGKALTNRRQFARLLPILTLTTTLVITIIKSSLALSLGLVGALSIVRFRTAIKEPEELMFLFLAIAIGLGVGADQRWATILGVVVVLGYMAIHLLLARKPNPQNLYVSIAVDENSAESDIFDKVNSKLLEYVEVVDFRRLDSRGGQMQITYFIECHNAATVNALVEGLKAAFPISEISFIQQDPSLGG